jgi:hypothetical protein
MRLKLVSLVGSALTNEVEREPLPCLWNFGTERLYVIPYVTALFNQLAEPQIAHSSYILFRLGLLRHSTMWVVNLSSPAYP